MAKDRRVGTGDGGGLWEWAEKQHPKLEQLLTVDDIYARATQELLEQWKEDRRIERKPAGQHPETLGRYFSMWANTPDGGLLVIGMENDGSIKAKDSLATKPTKHLNRLEQTGRDYCADARYETKRIEARADDGTPTFLLLIRIYFRPDKLVRDNQAGAWVRIGDSKKKLTDEECREFEIDRGQIAFEREPSGLEYPENFDANLIRQFASGIKSQRGLPDHLGDEEILELRHLGKRVGGKFVPNNACAVAFGKDPTAVFPGCKVRFQRFDGTHEGEGERYNIVKDEWIEGPVPTLISETARVLDSQVRKFKKLGPNGIFEPIPEYPKLAWQEAIVNACVHRSYGLRNMNIFVKMFDDRLVVESPGGFPPLVTPENIYEMHHPRNPFLMEAMFYLKLVMCAREGTRRMRATMTEMGLPGPEFEQKETGHALVRVTLRNNITHRKVWIDFDASSVVGEAIFKSLTSQERQIINYVAEYKKINVSQAMRVTGGKYWQSTRKILQGLKEKGILDDHRRQDISRDPEAYYFLRTEEGPKSGDSRAKPKPKSKKPVSKG
jgi:ATP-dependent DNA helicase RecG